MNWWSLYIAALVGAAAATAVTTPVFRHLSWRFDFLDRPLGQDHKQHDNAMPLLGGMAMIVGWLVTLHGGILVALFARQWLPPAMAEMAGGLDDPGVRRTLAVISVGAVFLGIMGMLDDHKPMGPGRKFALQLLLCGVVALHEKLQITAFSSSLLVRWPLTVLWYIFIVNAFNFFDNMDGLAAGVAAIASFLFAVVAGIQGQVFVATLAAITAGTAAGFYAYNRNPATIFMGDSGSHFLGFILAALAALTTFYRDDSPTFAAVLIPLFILALPIFDTFAVIVIRLHLGRPVYSGDHNHISHRFLRMGMSRRTAVMLVHLLQLAIGLSVLPLLEVKTVLAVVIIAQAAVMLGLISVLHSLEPAHHPEQEKAAKAAQAAEPTAPDGDDSA